MNRQTDANTPLISVIIPIYKVEKYLARCLDSVTAQTYANLEVILVDDASTDSSGKICDAYARRDSRFQVIHLERNQGVSHARNTGIDKSTGDFVTFIDADDYVENDLVERLYENLTENQADVSMCRIDRIGFGTYKDSWMNGFESEASSVQAVTYMMSGDHFDWCVCFGKLFKRSLVRKYPFARQFYCGEDVLFVYRIFCHIHRVSYLPEWLYHYIYRKDSATHEEFSFRQYTESQVFEILCLDIKKKIPQLVPRMENHILNINVKLAVKAVESRTVHGRQLDACLRKFRENIRRHMSGRALCLFENKKIAAEVILLYVSKDLFRMVTELYKKLRGKIYD